MRYANFRNKIKYYSEKVAAAYDEEDKNKSLALWQEVFGIEFKAPAGVAAAREGAPIADTGEMFLERDFGIPTLLDTRYRLRIDGRIQPKNGFRSFRGTLRSRGGLVDKHRTVRFNVVECTVPGPYDVYWKIKNRGEAATKAECLRGEIVPDQGGQQRDEPTLYPGHHYVECYIVKNGVCVAVDRQPVVIT